MTDDSACIPIDKQQPNIHALASRTVMANDVMVRKYAPGLGKTTVGDLVGSSVKGDIMAEETERETTVEGAETQS